MNHARLAEHGKIDLPDWPPNVRRSVALAARDWQRSQRLNAPPLEWSGSDGITLRAKQWVGILEVEGYRVEIFPKLDAKLLENRAIDDALADSTLAALMPLLEAAHFGDWVETGRAELGVAPLSFIDIWAFLLGKNLWAQLQRGLDHAYLTMQDDLSAVRGKVMVSRQIAGNFNRFDRIACGWDEFSADTALNRLLKCACSVLRRRTSHPVARGLLGDCLFTLDEVADASPALALRETERPIWSRATQRFEPCFALARRILLELSPEMSGQNERAWTFLVNMNDVFEDFCHAALEARFGVVVETQKLVGTLFDLPKGGIQQKADYVWSKRGKRWIGDAKWKLLGQNAPTFDVTGLKPNGISPDNVRQLTTYADLLRKKEALEVMPQLAILYPLLGELGAAKQFPTWNGTQFHLWPVRVRGWKTLGDAIGI